jgi:acyl dehydratase
MSWPVSEQGRQLPTVQRFVDQEMVTAYAHASGDHNPIHLEADFAAASQFGAIVAHGMLTLAFVAQMMSEAFGLAWQERGTLKVRFKGPACPGDEVTTFGHVVRETEKDGETMVECAVGLKNQQGAELITGTASVRLPVG